jgi:hypothetical protein
MTNKTIEFAREAGFPMAWISENDGGVIRWKDIKVFEDLIRADEAAKWIKGVKVSIPTETMEYEFAWHYRKGYEAGKLVTRMANATE